MLVIIIVLFAKKNKTTAAVCISRRALKGRKYLFRDIHNFSFSAKIQDDIFPLGTEYCCTTPWVKNRSKLLCLLPFRRYFQCLFSAKIQDSRQKWRKLNFFPFCIVYSCTTLRVKNLLKITLSLTFFEILRLFHFPQNSK